MEASVKQRIAASQRARYARMRADAEHLSGLRSAHRRMMELWGMCEAIVRDAAADGDSLAAYVVGEIDRAADALTFANLVAAEDVGAPEESALSPGTLASGGTDRADGAPTDPARGDGQADAADREAENTERNAT
jgi:hypothetical protein